MNWCSLPRGVRWEAVEELQLRRVLVWRVECGCGGPMGRSGGGDGHGLGERRREGRRHGEGWDWPREDSEGRDNRILIIVSGRRPWVCFAPTPASDLSSMPPWRPPIGNSLLAPPSARFPSSPISPRGDVPGCSCTHSSPQSDCLRNGSSRGARYAGAECQGRRWGIAGAAAGRRAEFDPERQHEAAGRSMEARLICS